MDVQQIETLRSQALAQMEELLATSGPTITVNGTDVAWAPLLASLERTVDWCDAKLLQYQPYEVRSEGVT